MLINQAITSEKRFYLNDYQGDQANPGILKLTGHLPILIAAPHAVRHSRQNRIKKAEAMTGTIAAQLATTTGVHALILAKSDGQDPNHDPDCAFKSTLAHHLTQHDINLVINLHGMTEQHGCDIVIGSGLGQTINHQTQILETTTNTLTQYGLVDLKVDDPGLFPATNPHNLSQFSWRELQTPSFQIEISYRYRNPRKHPDKYQLLISTLTQTITNLAYII